MSDARSTRRKQGSFNEEQLPLLHKFFLAEKKEAFHAYRMHKYTQICSSAHALLAPKGVDCHLSHLVTNRTKHPPTLGTGASIDRCYHQRSEISGSSLNPLATPIPTGHNQKEKIRGRKNRMSQVLCVTPPWVMSHRTLSLIQFARQNSISKTVVSSYLDTCVLMLVYTRPHTDTYVCPHNTISVSSY